MTAPATRAARSKAASSLLDQAMSSASNGLIVLAVARVSSVDSFGAATLLFAFAAAAMGVGRGAIGTPIMLAADRGGAELRREAGFAATTALAFGLIVSSAAAVTSVLLNVPRMGVAFSIAIPLVVVVDVFRYTLISASKPNIALIWDALWAIGSALLLLITLFSSHAINDAGMVLFWAILAGITAVGMGLSYRLYPRFRGLGSWWWTTHGPRIRYGLEAGLQQINVIVVTSIATAMLGASAAAALRGASVIMSPLAILLNAVPLMIIPESVRSGASARAVWRKLCRIGFVGSLLVITLGPALMLLPLAVGQLILGDSWLYVRAVLPIVSIECAALVWCSMAMGYLRFQGRSGNLLAATFAYCVAATAMCAVMAFLTGKVVGVAAGSALVAVAMATVMTFYVHPARERRQNHLAG